MTGRPAETKSPVRLLMIDNYDSFTFNLVQYLGELGAQVDVVRNDVKTVDELLERDPAGVVISPGPGEPKSAGITVEIVSACAKRGVPLLGVCLGHQSIGVAFGGQIVRARSIMHGKVSSIEHDGGPAMKWPGRKWTEPWAMLWMPSMKSAPVRTSGSRARWHRVISSISTTTKWDITAAPSS